MIQITRSRENVLLKKMTTNVVTKMVIGPQWKRQNHTQEKGDINMRRLDLRGALPSGMEEYLSLYG